MCQEFDIKTFKALSIEEQTQLAESWYVLASDGVVEYVGPDELEDLAWELKAILASVKR